MSQVELRVISGKQGGSSIPLQPGKFLIGREHDCHLRPNSELVSRHHCAFTLDEFALQIRDLGSTNGTFVNGERIRGVVVLNPGDRVSVGKLEFEVVIDGQPAATVTDTLVGGLDDTASLNPGLLPAGAAASDPAPDFIAADDASATVEVDAQAPTAVGEFPQFAGAAPEGFAPAAQGLPPGAYPPPPGQPWMPGQPYPYPGGYPQYPPMPYGYGYPYPGMAPGVPPAYPYPQQPAPEPPAAGSTATHGMKAAEGDVVPGIRLPDPKLTGAKDPDPPQPKSGDGAAPAKNIPSAAQDIINSYLQRRPKT